ncbi:hypothetical protein [Streptomyces sp. NRRL S-118]|uniref:hypothetical protein n=1 Tax=Streptomyces sp. NRRL S-118 TaxID=1463881 RepID=UPI0004C63091|nr:hypothetical protein [Streptomyces sp. NRRL S-118]
MATGHDKEAGQLPEPERPGSRLWSLLGPALGLLAILGLVTALVLLLLMLLGVIPFDSCPECPPGSGYRGA